jgi:hypothetical protein
MCSINKKSASKRNRMKGGSDQAIVCISSKLEDERNSKIAQRIAPVDLAVAKETIIATSQRLAANKTECSHIAPFNGSVLSRPLKERSSGYVGGKPTSGLPIATVGVKWKAMDLRPWPANILSAALR